MVFNEMKPGGVSFTLRQCSRFVLYQRRAVKVLFERRLDCAGSRGREPKNLSFTNLDFDVIRGRNILKAKRHAAVDVGAASIQRIIH